MTNNFFLGPDAEARFALEKLKAEERSGTIAGEITNIVDGVFLANDPDAQLSGDFHITKGGPIALNMTPTSDTAPRWQALHLRLGGADLSKAHVIGFVARSSAPAAMITRACLRSERDGHFVDTFFPKAIASFATASTHFDILELDGSQNIPPQAEWREFILFFRPGDIKIELQDLRLFIV